MVWRIHSIPMALFSRRMRTLQGTLMHDVFITVPVAGRMASRRIDATFAAWLGPSHTASHTVLVGQPEKTTQFLLLKLPSFIFVGSPQFLGVQHDGRVNSPRCQRVLLARDFQTSNYFVFKSQFLQGNTIFFIKLYVYIYNMISRLLVSFPQLPDCPNSLLLLVNCPNCGVSVVSGRNLPHHVCCSIDYWHSFQHFPKIPSQLLKVNNINSHKVPQTVLNSQKLPETAKCDGPMLNYNDLTLRRHPK